MSATASAESKGILYKCASSMFAEISKTHIYKSDLRLS